MATTSADVIRKWDTLSNMTGVGGIRAGQKGYVTDETFIKEIHRHESTSAFYYTTVDDGQMLLTETQSVSGDKTFIDSIYISGATNINNVLNLTDDNKIYFGPIEAYSAFMGKHSNTLTISAGGIGPLNLTNIDNYINIDSTTWVYLKTSGTQSARFNSDVVSLNPSIYVELQSDVVSADCDSFVIDSSFITIDNSFVITINSGSIVTTTTTDISMYAGDDVIISAADELHLDSFGEIYLDSNNTYSIGNMHSSKSVIRSARVDVGDGYIDNSTAESNPNDPTDRYTIIFTSTSTSTDYYFLSDGISGQILFILNNGNNTIRVFNIKDAVGNTYIILNVNEAGIIQWDSVDEIWRIYGKS